MLDIAVIQSHKEALSRFPDTNGPELNQLELDIHARLLKYANNSVAMIALQSTKAGLISSKHIVASKEVPLGRNDPFIEEHIDILAAIDRRNVDESKLRLLAHLIKSKAESDRSTSAVPHSCPGKPIQIRQAMDLVRHCYVRNISTI